MSRFCNQLLFWWSEREDINWFHRLFVFTLSIASHDKSETVGFIDSSVGYTDAHKQLKLIKTLNGTSARLAKHCEGIKTQLDLPASSMYFSSSTHQPCLLDRFTGTYPTGFALVTQTHTHSHPRIWNSFFFFVFRRGNLICSARPCNIISLRKLFMFQYLKRQKGKHRKFIWLLYSLAAPSNRTAAHVTASDDSHKVSFQLFAACLIALPQAYSHKSHLQDATPSWGQKGSPSAHSQSNRKSLLQLFAQLFPTVTQICWQKGSGRHRKRWVGWGGSASTCRFVLD